MELKKINFGDKKNMTKIIAVLLYLAFFANVKSEDQCAYTSPGSTTYICNCYQDEDLNFYLENSDMTFSGDNKPVVVKVRGCSSVTFDLLPGPIVEYTTEEFVFENIGKTLNYGAAPKLGNISMTFLNVANVMWLYPESFSEVDILKKLHVENTKMELFHDIFNKTDVQNVVLKNVTMENREAIQLKSSNGEHLEIIDSRIKVTEGTYIFEGFKNISIKKTIFEFSKPGKIRLIGGEVILNQITLINTSLDVIEAKKIDIRGTCSFGKESRISLNSSNIFSHGNKGPNEIGYIMKQHRTQGDNKVCVDDNCNCNLNNDWGVPRKLNHAGTIHRSSFLLFALVLYSLLTGI